MKVIKKSLLLSVGNIHKNLFVRETLDQDRALYFGQLIEDMLKQCKGGKEPELEFNDKVKPIVVTPAYKLVGQDHMEYLPGTPHYEMVDGRHRLEGWMLNGVDEVEVTVNEFDTETEMISWAYKANEGAKPPTQADREHIVKIFVQKGLSAKAIAENLGMPTGIVRAFVETVKSKLEQIKKVEAITLIERGKTIPEAAATVGMDEEKLREVIAGRKRRKKNDVAEMQRELSNKARGITRKNTELFKKLVNEFEDGDRPATHVRKVMTQVKRQQETMLRNTEDAISRFEALIKGDNSNGKAS